ncbi:MAG: hypothetical protein P4L91_13500 [Burkholderiaceae bacterium]|nr:hypothetical protein [Burkholderiaceae bacterium]
MRIVISLLMLSLLGACVSQAERTAQATRQVEQMIQTYGPACEKLGYQRDSDAWRSCVLSLDSKENSERYPVTTNCFGPRGFIQCTTY